MEVTLHRCLLLLASAATLFAESGRTQPVLGEIGHQVTGQFGTAGSYCCCFSCTPQTLGVAAGETLTMYVTAPLQSYYAIGASFSATSCVSIPGLWHGLVLDAPIVILASGAVSQATPPALACWGGHELPTLPLPSGLPVGVSFTTQAIAAVPSPALVVAFAFSTPVTMTVQ